MEMLNVGFDNAVSAERVIAIISVNSTPVKRMVETARKSGVLIDATRGKKTKAAVITDSNHCVLSAIQADTLISRWETSGAKKEKKTKEKEPDKK